VRRPTCGRELGEVSGPRSPSGAKAGAVPRGRAPECRDAVPPIVQVSPDGSWAG
jgi:hypothetical protein